MIEDLNFLWDFVRLKPIWITFFWFFYEFIKNIFKNYSNLNGLNFFEGYSYSSNQNSKRNRIASRVLKWFDSFNYWVKNEYDSFNWVKNDFLYNFENSISEINKFFGIKLYKSQIEAAYWMTKNTAVELDTGEGKTFSILLASLFCLKKGERVIVLTVNDYLVSREYEWSKAFWKQMGFESAQITEKTNIQDKFESYSNASIIYTTNSRLIFDYMEGISGSRRTPIDFQSRLIFDEIDMILIDNAGVPFIISSDQSINLVNLKRILNHAVTIFYQMVPDEHYIELNEVEISVTEEGYDLIETLALDLKLINHFEELYQHPGNKILESINSIIKAYVQMKRNINYVVLEDEIIIINELTGRLEPQRKFSDSLQNALEFKEGLTIKPVGTFSFLLYYQNLINLFDKKSGTSGTILEEWEELFFLYGLRSIRISPQFQSRMKVEGAENFKNQSKVIQKSFDIIKSKKELNLPTLIIASDLIYLNKLEKIIPKTLSYQRIDALNIDEEEEKLAKIGLPGQITLSTHVTGRGSDVLLGGDWEKFKLRNKEMKEKSLLYKNYLNSKGGLSVIVMGLNSSGRIDRQALGRSARQGFNGTGWILRSLQDETFKNIGMKTSTALTINSLLEIPNKFHSYLFKFLPNDTFNFRFFKESPLSKIIQRINSWANTKDRINSYRINFLSSLFSQKLSDLSESLKFLFSNVSDLKNKISFLKILQIKAYIQKLFEFYDFPFEGLEIEILLNPNLRDIFLSRIKFVISNILLEKIRMFNIIYEDITFYSFLQMKFDPMKVIADESSKIFDLILNEVREGVSSALLGKEFYLP